MIARFAKSPLGMVLFLAGIIAYFLYLENTSLQITRYEISFRNLPEDFHGFRIALISDLHGSTFGDRQGHLLSAIREFQTNMVAITGDLVDGRWFTLDPALCLVERLCCLTPVYYVCGNHEVASGRLDFIQERLETLGVRVLRNEKVTLDKGKSEIILAGLDDPLAIATRADDERQCLVEKTLLQILKGVPREAFTLLLAHRPDLLPIYAAHNVSLTLSGHAHGGLIRLPGIGGIFAPGQGLFPRLTEGVHINKNTKMVVSRGLGNSGGLQVRIFNRPELVLVTLRTEP